MFTPELFEQKDKLNNLLDKLFGAIIDAGAMSFAMASRFDTTLNATNYLKKDKNYYFILDSHWSSMLAPKIKEAMGL